MSRDQGGGPPLFTLKDICSILGRRNILRRNYAYKGGWATARYHLTIPATAFRDIYNKWP